MEKRDIFIFIVIIMFGMIILLMNKVSAGNTTSTGVINLYIENNSCGNGFCTPPEDCNNCPEDCGACPAPSPGGGGGGGGGGGVSRQRNLTINKDLIKVTLKQGESKRETLIINNGDSVVNVNLSIDSESLKKHMIMSEYSFYLTPGESKQINIDFFAKEDELADTYIGRIIVNYGSFKKVVNVILDIKEKQALFDVLTKVQNPYTVPGKSVNANIKITNLGEVNNIDVTLYYAIKDFDNKVITFREETLAVNKEITVNRAFKLPDNFPIGKYVFYSKINYGKNQTATSSDVFNVITEWELIMRYVLIAVVITIAIILILIIVILVRRAARRYYELKNLRAAKPENNSYNMSSE